MGWVIGPGLVWESWVYKKGKAWRRGVGLGWFSGYGRPIVKGEGSFFKNNIMRDVNLA